MNSFLEDMRLSTKEALQEISGIDLDKDEEGESWFYSTLCLSYGVGLLIGSTGLSFIGMCIGWKI
jgi:hypothetical protein